MDPALLVALVPTFVAWGAIVFVRKVDPRPRRMVQRGGDGAVQIQAGGNLELTPKEVYQLEYAAAKPDPWAAWTHCPLERCGELCVHYMVEPDPARRAYEVHYRVPAEEVYLWASATPYRSTKAYTATETRGFNEVNCEVIRVCSKCGARWGVTAAGTVLV